VSEALGQIDERAKARRKKWRLAMFGFILMLLGGVLTQRLIEIVWPKMDWWAGQGFASLVPPERFAARVGPSPFHWGVLVHRTSDGEAGLFVFLTRDEIKLLATPSRTLWTRCYGGQEPGLGDEALMGYPVEIERLCEQFSDRWHRAIGGAWDFRARGPRCVLRSVALGEEIDLGDTTAGPWARLWAYHYWRPEDGDAPSLRPEAGGGSGGNP